MYVEVPILTSVCSLWRKTYVCQQLLTMVFDAFNQPSSALNLGGLSHYGYGSRAVHVLDKELTQKLLSVSLDLTGRLLGWLCRPPIRCKPMWLTPDNLAAALRVSFVGTHGHIEIAVGVIQEVYFGKTPNKVTHNLTERLAQSLAPVSVDCPEKVTFLIYRAMSLILLR